MCLTCSQYNIHYPHIHNDNDCPINKCKYCSFCARNGHTTTECPYDTEIQSYKIQRHHITEFIIDHIEDVPSCFKNLDLDPNKLKLWFHSYIQRYPQSSFVSQKNISWNHIKNEFIDYCMPEIIENIYGEPEEEYLEVVDYKVNIRAVLIAFGIKLSGIEDVNRQNVEILSRRLGCKMRWIPFCRAESLVKVDEKPSRQKKSKAKKLPQTPIDSEDEDYISS